MNMGGYLQLNSLPGSLCQGLPLAPSGPQAPVSRALGLRSVEL